MKITINPLEIPENEKLSILLKNLNDTQDMFSRIKTALNNQKVILNSIQKIRQKTNDTESELAFLIDELDKISDNCTESNVPLINGSFSRYNPLSSIWFTVGFNSYKKVRIYLQTMTSSGLGLKSAGKIYSHPNNIKKALDKINKSLADVDGYLSRIKFIESSWKASIPSTYQKIRLERNIKKHQIELIKTAQNSIHSTYGILKRLQELATKAADKNTREQLYINVEVSSLINEIDRIASQTNFNRIRLLNGTFSKTTGRSTMWLIIGEGIQDKKSVFIPELNAYSLGLKDNIGKSFVVADSNYKFAKVVKSSIKQLADEHNALTRIIKEIEKMVDIK